MQCSIIAGPIGNKLEQCEKLKVVNFEVIECQLPNINCDVLSTDHNNLLEIRNAFGKMSHALWLTTANRILRLDVATESPSQQFKNFAEFVVKVYARV